MYLINEEVVVIDKTKAIASPGTLAELFELNNFAGTRPENGVVGIVRDKTYHPTIDNCLVYVVEAIGTVLEDIIQDIEGVPTVTGTQPVDKVLQYLVKDMGLAVSNKFYVTVKVQVTASDEYQAVNNVTTRMASKLTIIESHVEEVPNV